MPCQWRTYDSAESASKVELFFPLLSLTSVIKDMCQFFKNINACRLWNDFFTLNIASKMIYKWIRLACTLECVCVCAFYWTSTIHWIRWSKSCSTRRNLEDQWVIWFGRFWNRFCATGFCYTFVFNLNFTSYVFTKLLKTVKMTVVKFYTAFLIFLKLTPMEDFCVVSVHWDSAFSHLRIPFNQKLFLLPIKTCILLFYLPLANHTLPLKCKCFGNRSHALSVLLTSADLLVTLVIYVRL